MGLPPEGAVLNFVVRMVVPMRREFGRSLDVQRFLHEPEYAAAVLEQALASRDQRLRDYAEYVKRHMGGAREVDAPRAGPLVRYPLCPTSADRCWTSCAASGRPSWCRRECWAPPSTSPQPGQCDGVQAMARCHMRRCQSCHARAA